MRPDDHHGSFDDEQLVTPKQEELLRRGLRSSVSSMPSPPPELPVSLLRAVGQERASRALGATVALIRAQWPVVARERLVLGMAVMLALVFLAAGGLMSGFDLLVLAGALPVAAGLFTLLLSGSWSDPAHVLVARSEEHTSELQSRPHLVCRLLLEK